jgi:hypothetical protein
MVRYSQREIVTLVILIGFTVFTQTSCQYWREVNQRTEKAVQELEVLEKKTPIPVKFVPVRSEKTMRFGYVTNLDRYLTTTDCSTVGAHFRRHFIDERWDPKLMRVEDVGGGLKTRDFTFENGEYSVTVECQIDVNPGAEKVVVIAFEWRPS